VRNSTEQDERRFVTPKTSEACSHTALMCVRLWWIAAQRLGAELRRTDRSGRRSGWFQIPKWRRSSGRTAASAPVPCWAATAV